MSAAVTFANPSTPAPVPILPKVAAICTPSPTKTEPFEGMHPQTILDLCLAVPAGDCLDGKRLWASYKKWSKMSETQKQKTVTWFNTNLFDSVRERVLANARQSIVEKSNAESERAASTNKHDKCRLLHLRGDIKFALLWLQTCRDFSRPELDDHYNSKFRAMHSLYINL